MTLSRILKEVAFGLIVLATAAAFVYAVLLTDTPDDLPKPWPSQSAQLVAEQETRTPAAHEVVRWFIAMTEDGRVDYTSITFTDGTYTYTCTVPGSGSVNAGVATCKLF